MLLSLLLCTTLLLHSTVFAINEEENDIDAIIQEVTHNQSTTTDFQSNCTCVPFYTCSDNNTIIKDGSGLITLRFNSGQCENYIDKCCRDPDNTNIIPQIEPIKVSQTRCGQWNSRGIGFRIIGNDHGEAQFGEFPWMVAILKHDTIENKNAYLCGASLIHPNVVMTAFHCIQDKEPDDLVIRAGEWDSKMQIKIYPFQDSRVSKIVKHEKYNANTAHNDIALIFLTTPFNLTDNVGTVCLPPRDFQFNKEQCYVTGWGKDVFGKQSVQQAILKKIDLKMVPHDICQAQLRQTRLTKWFNLHESFICAGGEVGKDACKGDGGSPLVCPTPENPEQFHQSGIVAWGIDCGQTTPGVYVDVSHFRLWIDQQMVKHGYDTSFYDANYEQPSKKPPSGEYGEYNIVSLLRNTF